MERERERGQRVQKPDTGALSNGLEPTSDAEDAHKDERPEKGELTALFHTEDAGRRGNANI